MSVHYKFKSSLDFDTITFDGLHISVNDFRKAVIQQKRLGKTNDFELQITNAQTKEEYENENDLIPKNTSLIISRIPQTSKKARDTQNQNAPSVCHVPKFDGNTLDLSQMNASEEDKIQAMMAQSTVDYDPRGYQKIRGPGQTGEVPPTYRCYKCHQTGHWIKNCPLPHSSSKKSDIRRNTGIPKSFLQEKGSEKESSAEEIVLVEKQAEVPDELLCSICKDIFRDAVMIPCCGSSFCDDCVRTALLESEENECPDCKEKGTSPGSLIPNRFLRSSVNTFKNETGYERRRKNNGIHEANSNSSGNVPDTTSEKETKPETSEKEVIAENITKDLDLDLTPPKASPEREECEPAKNEDTESMKAERSEELHKKESVEPSSPKRRVEVVIPQREMSQNSEIQTRSEDAFKQSNPSNFSNYGSTVPEMQHRSNNTDHYSGRSDSFMRHQKQGQGITHPPPMGYCNNYGNRTERYYYPRDSYNVNTAPYPFMPNTRCRQMPPHLNIQPYYQGMSGTMETGIIEDPLEAFNRIMKEKEKRKEMKRLASDRHRSTAIKRGPRDPSPIADKRRHRVSPINERRNRSPLRQEKTSIHRHIEREKNIRSHRSHYPSSKRSFSRSNSPPLRRYSKSPRRRSRSRSHPRSHSREMDLLRHDNRSSSKHVLQQTHRTDYDKDIQRYNKKPSGRFSEARSVSESGPKENRRHNSKMRENGSQNFDNYVSTGSRKAFIETDNVQDNKNLQYEYHEKKCKPLLNKLDDGIKIDKKSRENEDTYSVQPYEELPKQEIEKKTKERKKNKKEKDDKTERKSKKDKKDKKKRERHKDDIRKHSEYKKSRKEPDSTSTANTKLGEVRNDVSDNRKHTFNEESLDDKNETFTPDININRNVEIDSINEDRQKEGDNRLNEDNNTLYVDKSPITFKNDRYKRNTDNNCSELNTPTSFVDTTPENYAGKWDNFDFSMPNSEDMRGENARDCEYDSHIFKNSLPSMKNDQLSNSRNANKNRDAPTRLHQSDDKKSKNEDISVEKRKEKRFELPPKESSRKPSPTPSEAMSSSTNNSNEGKISQSKKRRKKSKHKKDRQNYKRSSSAESSKNSRKSASKHKKNRSEKKKKMKRTESSR